MEVINKTMDRTDLLLSDAVSIIEGLNTVIEEVNRCNLAMSSWVGSLPPGFGRPYTSMKELAREIFRRFRGKPVMNPKEAEKRSLYMGLAQRLDYEPFPDMADDLKYPWFLYWEAYWVLRTMQPFIQPNMRILDGGGTSSLFTCYLASMGHEVHSVDLNPRLKDNGDKLAHAMGWNMHSYAMDLRKLSFPDQYFDHAFSICVFEHLDYDIKQAALREIARCLRPSGILSLTFDYRNPAPGVAGYGKDTRPRNQLKTEDDIKRSFLATGLFEMMGNQEFYDNQKSYLLHPAFPDGPYTFGAIFLKKK